MGNWGSTDSKDDTVMAVEGSPPVVLQASDKHTATVIFFHGLGDEGSTWADIFKKDIKLPYVKSIFPNAAERPVSISFRMSMAAWYDLIALDDNSPEDEAGIKKATEYVHELINAEIKAGIPSERIIIGGFSMGGALAIYAGLTFDKPLGGIIGLSTWLLQRRSLPGQHTANLKTPIFLGHGTEDALVPIKFGEASRDAIKKFNPNVELKSYPIEHTSSSAEFADINAFIATNLA